MLHSEHRGRVPLRAAGIGRTTRGVWGLKFRKRLLNSVIKLSYPKFAQGWSHVLHLGGWYNYF